MIITKNEVNEMTIQCILYDSFYLVCGFGEQYGEFVSYLQIPNGYALNTMLGEFDFNSDVDSIKKRLKSIDHYCVQSLPDKFLRKYKRSYIFSKKLKMIERKNSDMNNKEIDDIRHLTDLVESYLGNKVLVYGLHARNTIEGILYETFIFRMILDSENKQVKGEIVISKSVNNSRFFGKEGICSNKENEIKELLDIVDDYCQKRLPDKFLHEYFKVYKNKKKALRD